MKNGVCAVLFVIQLISAQGYQPIGKYTGKNWQQWIDTTWGQGISTAEKLSFFDTFWNIVDQSWAGFPNSPVNWDSLKSVYRPMVEAGVSRGRFYGIISRLTRALNEWHVFASDMGIDSTFKAYVYSEYPLTSFLYKPGVPLFNANEMWFRSNFGAGVTALPDSSAMIYSVMPGHPLGLQPGDIILGYDGIPWEHLMEEIHDAELPMLQGGAPFGSTLQVYHHMGIMSIGMNWGLFDTIDIFKYSTKQTLHYPTSLLKTITPPYFPTSEQLPVNGVPFPNIDTKKLVSWGVVEGTTIGYIYAWDWYGVPFGDTQVLFGQAISDLVLTKKVTGLILDFRTNWGGAPRAANTGFSILFNEDPTSNYTIGNRIVGNDHLAFSMSSAPSVHFFTPSPYIFDRPIAVLNGPNSGSSGDYNAFRMRFHPMARSFGKPTNGAFSYNLSPNYIFGSSYWYALAKAIVYSNVNNEGYMVHKGSPVDEELWLTQEGVSKGEDDVVQRALEWINSEAYAHSPITNKTVYGHQEIVELSVTVQNPLHHDVALAGKLVYTNGIVADSALFYNDGLHGDGAANDSVWGCFLNAPPQNSILNYSIRFTDKTSGKTREVYYKYDITVPVNKQADQLPLNFSLSQNFPNPFNPITTIRYALPSSAHVKLTVHDVLGREMVTLVNEEQTAGWKEVEWNASGFAGGMYVVKMTTNNFVETKKILLMK